MRNFSHRRAGNPQVAAPRIGRGQILADLFDRLGRDTSDMELAYEVIKVLMRTRKRESQMEAALRKIYDPTQHAPVATKAAGDR